VLILNAKKFLSTTNGLLNDCLYRIIHVNLQVGTYLLFNLIIYCMLKRCSERHVENKAERAKKSERATAVPMTGRNKRGLFTRDRRRPSSRREFGRRGVNKPALPSRATLPNCDRKVQRSCFHFRVLLTFDHAPYFLRPARRQIFFALLWLYTRRLASAMC